MEPVVGAENSPQPFFHTCTWSPTHTHADISYKTKQKKHLFYMRFACMSTVVTCMPGACRGQNRAMDPLKLESSAGSQSANY